MMSSIPLLGVDGQMPSINLVEYLQKIKELSKKRLYAKCQNFNDFKVLSMLSHSHDSFVVKAEDKVSGEEYVLKKLKYPKNSPFGFPLNAIREAAILNDLKHVNIVLKEGFAIEPNLFKNYIVFEYCKEDLTQLLKTISKLDESEVKCLVIMLLKGLSHLYDNLIIHRDISPDNLFIHPSGMLKIGDFGKARLCEKSFIDEMNVKHYLDEIGTPGYKAPELILNYKDCTRAVDMWSFGCIFSELLNHKPIFSKDKYDDRQMNDIIKLCGSPDAEYMEKLSDSSLIRSGILLKQDSNTFKEAFLNVNAEGIKLLRKCFCYDWSIRIKPEDCLNDVYFDNKPKALMPENLLSHLWRKRIRDNSEINTASENLMYGPVVPSSDMTPNTILNTSLRTDRLPGTESLSEGGITDSS